MEKTQAHDLRQTRAQATATGAKTRASNPGLPKKQGLYDPRNERDACGVGFVAHLKGQKSHQIVKDGRKGSTIHYGGDHPGSENNYRKGTLYFFNNTVHLTGNGFGSHMHGGDAPHVESWGE